MSTPLNNLIADDAEVPALKPRSKPKADKPAAEKKVTIVLEESDEIPPTGQFIQFGAGHMLRSFMLRPGEEAEVPQALLNVLDAAVLDVPQIDQTTKQVIGYRKKLRFPYRVVRQA
jgi:hypothetical protein